MTACDSIKQSFKALVVLRSYDRFTVSDVCQQAGVSRKTFYAHFQDKRAVVSRIFVDEALKPVEELHRLLHAEDLKSAPKLLTEHMYQSMYDDREYYTRLVGRNADYTFVDIVTAEIAKMNHSLLASYNVTDTEREYMAYFFAAAQAMLMFKWIREGMRITPQQMAQYFIKWSVRSWIDVNSNPQRFNW